ncbi:Extensin family protein [Rhizobium sp. CF080]|uniref:extensin family protein n=1 Tax=Rhizobium sp. (strain CF080) TaxID=1144310 RepID=UPI0002717030|nr:extensin family protein [Rhizobium sp. CF080]EUB96920.1 Extensin family protein [Rhizobium sp. CF080]
MQHSWIAILAGLPLIIGAAMPPERPIPQAQYSGVPVGVVEVNFLTRLLQDGSRDPAPRRRASPRSQARGAVPPPPAPENVPLPIPKPVGEAAKPAEAAQQADNTADKPVVQEAPPPKVPPPVAPPPVAQNRPNENPQSPPPSPPVVEQPGTASEPAHAAEVPKPLPKPGTTAADAPADKPDRAAAPEQDVAKPEDAKPNETKADAPDANGKQPDEQKAEAPPPPPPPPLVKEDPEELKACLADLTSLGAKFEPTDPIDDGNGCGIESPIDVTEVLPGVSLGGATMRCKTAVSMAHWLKDTVQPALNIAMPGRKITGLVPGSTYACRLRNSASTGKISEHARGNAFDVAAFKLDNGEKMTMKPRDEDSTMEGAFQRTATAGACLHFTTVLSPGSDAAHQNHLHLDVLERKDGYRYCR